ncbi:biotin-dependent carboxyltransferase family protein [Mesonia ostreae]|uniref:Biotin-dependent carboxyltransferase family protein n=1 Tax=Mesonia ostreae TaxID=861110 RepID=A0ABU2KGH1_9FLAO|nr:biotin-dependent carboxyltransferase family protein [Mesonia ostreae]MDT0293805.1 biotin-dependent carboxyltransferase family protein [Mesonia ostreae]
MSVKVIKEGLLSSVQDLGRFGFAGWGVPQSGVMDRYSAKMANLLVGNEEFEAVMELTLLGPILEFQEEVLIVVVGIEAQATLNGQKIELLKPFLVDKGDQLHIQQITQGVRAYIAISGGFKTKEFLKSRSQYYPITSYAGLQKGETLPFDLQSEDLPQNFAGIKYDIKRYVSKVLEVYKGPEWDRLSNELQIQLQIQMLTISKNNSRMAYQIDEQFPNSLEGMLSQPVLPGTVQLTPDGSLIILMRDAQTTGGYPRIFQLTEESIQILSQKKQGDKVEFKCIY